MLYKRNEFFPSTFRCCVLFTFVIVAAVGYLLSEYYWFMFLLHIFSGSTVIWRVVFSVFFYTIDWLATDCCCCCCLGRQSSVNVVVIVSQCRFRCLFWFCAFNCEFFFFFVFSYVSLFFLMSALVKLFPLSQYIIHIQVKLSTHCIYQHSYNDYTAQHVYAV